MKPLYKLLDAAERIGRIHEITLYNTDGPGLIIATPGEIGDTAKFVIFANFRLKDEDDDESCPPYETADMVIQDPVECKELESVGIDRNSTTWKSIESELKGPDSAASAITELRNALQSLQDAIGR